MHWKEMRQSGEFLRHLPAIWERECAMPKWFQASSFLWHPSFAVFVEWACGFPEIYGLFDGDKLLFVIYLERKAEGRVAEIHLAVLEKMPADAFVAEAATLRNRVFHSGVKYIRAWTLKKNVPLRKLMRAVGFRGDGFMMDRGHHRGQVLTWELLEAVRA